MQCQQTTFVYGQPPKVTRLCGQWASNECEPGQAFIQFWELWTPWHMDQRAHSLAFCPAPFLAPCHSLSYREALWGLPVCRGIYVLTPCHVPNTKRELLGMGALPSWKSLQRISSAAQLVSSSESAFRSLIRKAYQQVEFCTSPEGQPWGNQENGKCHTGYRMAWHQQGWMWGICAGAKFLALPRSFLSLGWEER